MAKANVNNASREEPIEAGVRAELADEIVKLRRKGKIALEALDELPGVGPATLEQLRKALDFGDVVEQTARETAETSKRVVREGTDTAAEAGRTGLQLVQRAVATAGENARELSHRTSEGTLEIGRELSDLPQEQARFNLAAWMALAVADWNGFWRLQPDHLQDSLERTARLTRCWFELSQAALSATAKSAHGRHRRARSRCRRPSRDRSARMPGLTLPARASPASARPPRRRSTCRVLPQTRRPWCPHA